MRHQLEPAPLLAAGALPLLSINEYVLAMPHASVK
jgi:hypothetical protein